MTKTKLTLICGDCREVLKTIPSESIDVILTDPPFMISREVKITRSRNPNKYSKFTGKDINFFFGDWDIFKNETEYWKFTLQWLDLAWKTLRKGGHFLCWFDKFKITPLVKWVEKHDGIARQPLFWIKENPVPCLTADDFLLTPSGLKKVIEVENDYLINQNGEIVKGIRSKKYFTGTLYKIYLWNIHTPLTLTSDHLIYAMKVKQCNVSKKVKCSPKFRNHCIFAKRNPNKCQKLYEFCGTEWIPAKELKTGDYLLYPRHYEINPQNTFEYEVTNYKERIYVSQTLNKELMWLIGFSLASASFIIASHYIRFYLSQKEKSMCFWLKKLIKKYFPAKRILIVNYKDRNKYEVRVRSPYLKAFLEKASGYRSYEKRIHPSILSQPPELLFELLQGYIQGNGSFFITNQNTKHISLLTCSPALAGQIFLILIRLGYYPCFHIEKKRKSITSKNETIITQQTPYTIIIRDTKLTEAFLNKTIIKEYYGRRSFVTEDYVFMPIRKIVKKKYSGIVYDYETDGSFLTLNGIVHNCARKVNFMNAVSMIFWATKHSTSRKYAVFNYEIGQAPDYKFAPIPLGKERYEHGFHPTQKPIKVIRWLLEYLSREGETILDPFMGSGSTLVVAKQLNRNAIGIDISKEYCELAYKRLVETPFQLPLNLDIQPEIVKIGF
jgi:DNA modification methylase